MNVEDILGLPRADEYKGLAQGLTRGTIQALEPPDHAGETSQLCTPSPMFWL